MFKLFLRASRQVGARSTSNNAFIQVTALFVNIFCQRPVLQLLFGKYNIFNYGTISNISNFQIIWVFFVWDFHFQCIFRSTGNSYRSSPILGRLLHHLSFCSSSSSSSAASSSSSPSSPQSMHWSHQRASMRRGLRLYLWRGRSSWTLPQLSTSDLHTRAQVMTMIRMMVMMIILVYWCRFCCIGQTNNQTKKQ